MAYVLNVEEKDQVDRIVRKISTMMKSRNVEHEIEVRGNRITVASYNFPSYDFMASGYEISHILSSEGLKCRVEKTGEYKDRKWLAEETVLNRTQLLEYGNFLRESVFGTRSIIGRAELETRVATRFDLRGLHVNPEKVINELVKEGFIKPEKLKREGWVEPGYRAVERTSS